MKKLTNKKAFTLTELIVVIVIIGILAAVLVPSLTSYIEKANESKAMQEARGYYQTVLLDGINDEGTAMDKHAVVVLDDKYVVTFVDGAFDQVTDYTETKTLGASFKTEVTSGNVTLIKLVSGTPKSKSLAYDAQLNSSVTA